MTYQSRRVFCDTPVTEWQDLDDYILTKDQLQTWLNSLGYGEVKLFEEGFPRDPGQRGPYLGCYLRGEGFQFQKRYVLPLE